jgi:hypothetical protein
VTRRRWVIVGSVAGGLVVVAIALGLYFWLRGSTPSVDAATWADQVCTSVSTWEKQIKTIATDVNGTPTKATIQTKIDQADAATKTLVSELKAIGLPKTPNGQTAQDEIKALAQSTQADFEKIKTEAGQLTGSGATGFVTGLATIATQAKDLVSKVQSTYTNLEGLGAELRNAIIHDSTCKSLA